MMEYVEAIVRVWLARRERKRKFMREMWQWVQS